MRIVLATWNEEKIRWLAEGFAALGLFIEAVDPSKCESGEEDGETCAENAEKKAVSVGFIEGAIVIAEDSGLACTGLNGFPGTHTSRWSPGNDQDRARILLERLDGIQDRRAHFTSSICILFPDGKKALVEGVMVGRISDNIKGDPRSGYASIFELGCGMTIAEIGPLIVDTYNHRQKAMQAACNEIRKWIDRQNSASNAGDVGSINGISS